MTTTKTASGSSLLKRSLVTAGILAVILAGMQIWFVRNARGVLQRYIYEQSNGKIQVELSQLDLNLLSSRLQIHEAELSSTDSLNDPITYHVGFSRVSVKVGSIWQLLVHKKLLLDSLKLYDPVIKIMLWRKDTAQVVFKDELSIPQEMGKVYNSLLDALDEFAVRRIIIDNAAISLINKMKAGSEPVTVSKIFFDLARTPLKSGTIPQYRTQDQTIELRTSNQDIALPGGRHRIAFKAFKLRLLRQSIEMDSCTVTAVTTDSVKSNYRVFFKKLFLTGVDFAALSGKNVIKADTVYCENPFFDLNLYRSDAVKKKTEIPDANKVIQDLTGNLDLGYAGVKNAGIHIDIYGKTKRSFFNSNKDNFEIRDFRVSPDSANPVSIARFDMTLRDYHLFNEDSSSMFSFDSLHFLNKKIILNNFAVLNTPGRSNLRNLVEVKVPYFELTSLDWYQLIFEQNLVAKEAVLNNPVINFTRTRTGRPGKKIDVFEALLNLDSLVALENVSVINGQVNGKLGPGTSFNVQDINFNVYSNVLLRSTNKEGVRNAVEHLSFSKGELRLKDITAQLQYARYTGNNLIYAQKIAISGQENKIEATVNNVLIDNLQLDDNAGNIEVDGLTWESAQVALKALPYIKNGSSKNSSSIHLRNVSGDNTKLNFSNGPTSISTFVESLNASSMLKVGSSPLQVEDFVVTGKDLSVNSNTLRIGADAYQLSGSDVSSFTGFRMQRVKGIDTLNISSSFVKVATDFNKLFANEQHLRYVHTTAPVIHLSKRNPPLLMQDSSSATLPVRIDQLTAIEPDITISTYHNDSVTELSIPWSDKSIVLAQGIDISGEGLHIDSVLVNTTSATYTKPAGQVLGVEQGKMDLKLSDINLGKKEGKFQWSGYINLLNLENASGLQLGKSKRTIKFQQAGLGNLRLTSDFLPDFNQLLRANVSAWLHVPAGEFIDSSRTLKWFNAKYVNSTRTLSLDSFIYHPTLSLDSVLAIAPYQLDYITVKTGAISIAGLDVEQYEKDSSIIASTISINQPVLTVFRDKAPPVSPSKKIRPLPVDMIKNIALPVSVNSVQFSDGTITYSEKNGKSGKQGDLLLTHVNGSLENIRNENFQADDSLDLTFNASLMDSAHVRLSLRESYTDSSSGFLLKAKISTASLDIFNTVLVPLLNVKITSGVLDSVSLQATAGKDYAKGDMNLHYRKLRIRLVKDGDPDRSTVIQYVTSFLANAFIVKSNNSKRTGMIFTKRSEEQSFINYIVKMSLSGVMSTVGLAKNKKYIKQYNREVREGRL